MEQSSCSSSICALFCFVLRISLPSHRVCCWCQDLVLVVVPTGKRRFSHKSKDRCETRELNISGASFFPTNFFLGPSRGDVKFFLLFIRDDGSSLYLQPSAKEEEPRAMDQRLLDAFPSYMCCILQWCRVGNGGFVPQDRARLLGTSIF